MLIKALTLHQPWATLIAIGAKRIETRSWGTDYRGPLAIHAGKSTEYSYLINTEPFWSVLKAAGVHHLPAGAIVAIADLVHVHHFLFDNQWRLAEVPMTWGEGDDYFELTNQERAFGDYSVGRYGLFLANIRRVDPPIPQRGYQMLWDYEWSGSDANS